MQKKLQRRMVRGELRGAGAPVPGCSAGPGHVGREGRLPCSRGLFQGSSPGTRLSEHESRAARLVVMPMRLACQGLQLLNQLPEHHADEPEEELPVVEVEQEDNYLDRDDGEAGVVTPSGGCWARRESTQPYPRALPGTGVL